MAAESAQTQPDLSAVAVAFEAHIVHAPPPGLKARDEQLINKSLVAVQAATLYAGSAMVVELQGVHADPRLVLEFDQKFGGHGAQDASAVELHGAVKVPAAQEGVEQAEQDVLETETEKVPGAQAEQEVSAVELQGIT